MSLEIGAFIGVCRYMLNKLFSFLAGGKKEKRPTDSSLTDMPLSRELQRRFVHSYIEQIASEREGRVPNGVYETSVVSFVFNHERIEGSSLTEWQTRAVFETRDTVLADSTTPGNVRETANHTKMFDFLFDSLDRDLTPEFIKEIHLQLMAGVMDVPGQWKILGNGVGSVITARPEEVPTLIDRLVSEYNKYEPSLENIVRFHVRFETIHPFPDGNGRVGRAIAFRECLRAGLVPFIVTDASKETYYTSLDEFRAGVTTPLISYAEAMQVDFASTIAPMLADRSLSDGLLGKLGIERPDFKDDAGFVGPSTKSLKSSLDSVGKTGSEIKSDHKTHCTRRV